MNKLFATTFLILFSLCTTAKDERYTFYLNLGSDLQLNKGDITNNTFNKNVLTMNNTASGRLGLEFHRKISSWLFMSAGTDYRVIPHTLNIRYESNKAGFANTNATYHEQISFTSHNIDPYLKFGYAVPFAKRSEFDFSFGVIFSIPVSAQKNEPSLVYLNITDNEYSDLAMYKAARWGNETPTLLPMKSLYTMQMAYRIMPRKEDGLYMKIGFDISGSMPGQMNKAIVNYYGNNRSDAGTSTFADRFQSIGLFVGFGI